MTGRSTKRKALHLLVYAAVVAGCTPPAPEERTRAAPTEQAIVVEDDPCGIHSASTPLSPLYPFTVSPKEPGELESSVTQVRLVRTKEPAVGTSTTFDVLHTFVGARRPQLEWRHGGSLHPINDMIEPHKIFALFELAPPPEGTIYGGCAVPPVGPFIRDINFQGSSVSPPRSILGVLENVEVASNDEIARALDASLPIADATTIGVALRWWGGSSDTATVGERTFLFHPPPTQEEMKRGVMPVPPVTSITIVTALRLGGTDTRVLISGEHSSPIGGFEEAGIMKQMQAREGTVHSRRFQALAQEHDGEMKSLATWFEPQE